MKVFASLVGFMGLLGAGFAVLALVTDISRHASGWSVAFDAFLFAVNLSLAIFNFRAAAEL